MKLKTVFIGLTAIVLASCGSSTQKTKEVVTKEIATEKASNVKVQGAMKNVMWKGELAGIINLNNIENKEGLYGLGPVEYLAGELLIVDGKTYISTVSEDKSMKVAEVTEVKAPFFVYANQTEWKEEMLPKNIVTISELEKLIDLKTANAARPFVFKLVGKIENAKIHIQNLPKGAKVSSPTEAHQGQVNYDLEADEVTVIGFFSTQHKGIFTHHDSFIHLHLITKDRTKMGHLDKVTFGEMKLYLPKD